MITIPKNISPELQTELKRWNMLAKKYKMMPTLYIIDNILKNTCGYENKGIIRFIDAVNCRFNPKDKDDNAVLKIMRYQKNRFKEAKINVFNSTHYDFFLSIKKLINHE